LVRALRFRVWDRLVLVEWVRVFCNYIPGVDEARKEAETAECDVDETISRADTTLDPYSERREDNGDNSKEAVGGTHFEVGSAWID